jgi:hypothetical protein
MPDTLTKSDDPRLARFVATEAEQQKMAELVKEGQYPLFGFEKKNPDSSLKLDLVSKERLEKNGAVSWKSFNTYLNVLTQIITNGLVDFVGQGFEQIQKNARTRFLLLEQRVAALEDRSEKTIADAYRGTWQPQNLYTRGCLVTWSGSLWLCMAASDAKPGTNDHWRQITQRGKDGKDAQ